MNKPVAWMHKTIPSWVSTFIHPETEPDEWIPLYTHPAELTDKEILEIANGCLVGATAWHNPELDPIKFAKAILRKAQEK